MSHKDMGTYVLLSAGKEDVSESTYGELKGGPEMTGGSLGIGYYGLSSSS